jgi:hypothetical protein
LYFVFANTGLEHEKTLEFVNKCDKHWGLNLVWIESVTHQQKGIGQTYKIVNYASASRDGEPFEQHIKKEGLSGPGIPRCSGRLKSIPLNKYRRSIDPDALACVGIRVDEIDRINPNSKKEKLIYPLISMVPTTKAEIRYWFKEQYSLVGVKDGQRRYWFREYLTVDKLIEMSKCEFTEFKDHMPELQYDLLGYDMDAINGCSESCEAFV